MKSESSRFLRDYIRAEESAYSWGWSGESMLSLRSLTWQGHVWEHAVTLTKGLGDTAILVVTGGDANELDLAEERELARLASMPVATLFHIPNQPFWGLWEDDFVAYTFEQFLSTGDPSWPLLFPMTKSVHQAMRAIDEATSGAIKRFVITGLSKRGWTSWLTAAAGGARVAAIAPMVIDTLNFPAQMAHQIKTWGDYSDEIESYTSSGLVQLLATEEGRGLSDLVDPYTYRGEISVPTLIVNGSNDPYWQVDALQLYWDELKQPKWASIVPNVGHILGDKVQKLETLSAFARSVAGNAPLPEQGPQLKENGERWIASAPGSLWSRIQVASSNNLDFRNSIWEPCEAFAMRPVHCAVFAEARYRSPAGDFTLSSPARVFPARRR